jgi:leader peptidase (prepilin peptidase)/N-methyltransferase
MTEWSFIVILFLFGSIIGSFLNVCIARIPSGESVVFPGSHCPECSTPIPFYHNIPLFSYLVLRGRCKYCGIKISPQYLVTEALTPLIMIFLFYQFGLSLAFAAAIIFSCALIVITFIDLKHKIIPDIISLPGIVLCFAASFFVPWTTPVESAVGILTGGGILWLFAAGYKLPQKKDGMGGGDIKLLAMIGAFLGWKGVLLSLMIGSFTGSLTGIFLMLLKGRDLKYAVPFGPFLSIGAFCALVYGEELVRMYLSIGA